VWLSPLPIALGHALSIAIVAGAFLWAGYLIDLRAVRIGAGLFLIGWAIYHWRYGHRHRVRVGMQAGLAALALWSFLMATTHGGGPDAVAALDAAVFFRPTRSHPRSAHSSPRSWLSRSTRWRC